MESNVYIRNTLNDGLLIHPKLNTCYMMGPIRLDPKGGFNSVELAYPIENLVGVGKLFLVIDGSNVGTVRIDNRYTFPSPVGDINVRASGNGYEIVVQRHRVSNRGNGAWSWSRLGESLIFTGYITAYVGVQRG